MPPALPAQSLADRVVDTCASVLFVEGLDGINLARELQSEFYSVDAVTECI